MTGVSARREGVEKVRGMSFLGKAAKRNWVHNVRGLAKAPSNRRWN